MTSEKREETANNRHDRPRKPPGQPRYRWQEEKSMNMIGICGDNCCFCPRYLATQNNDADKLEDVKELWVRFGLRDPAFPAQDMACFGCRPENKCAYSEVRTCANRKEIENCGLCHEYPCELINTVFEESEKFRSQAVLVCTTEEMNILHKAFFSKRQNLDKIRFGKNKDREK